jgi:dienelactone hydrolase
MLGASGALFDAAYLQRGLREHRWYTIKGLAGATDIKSDRWTGEIAIPFAGLSMKSGVKGNWPINVCRTSHTKKGVRSYLSSWGVFREKTKLDKWNFFPVTILRSTRSESAVFDLMQEVAGIPAQNFTEEEMKTSKKYRHRQEFDRRIEELQMIVIPPKLPLASLMFYRDKDGNKQPIETDVHHKLKRTQSREALQKGMGELPERLKRTNLKDFNIRTTGVQQRGRYIKKHIHYDVANGEVVHAFLYEPIGLKPGEKRPGIIAHHPTARFGKQTFEGWPNSNFVTELAMQGFVVIVPDYPTKGEAMDDDLKADRYDSGPIRGVYNHMSSVDLLQLLPSVDPNRIGAIGHSLGGRNTVYLMAFDERVKVGVSSCGWSTFRATTILHERLLATDYFMPLLKTKYNLDLAKFPFEYTDAFAAIAPRVFYSYSPAGDGVHPGWGPATAAPVIRKYYDSHGAKDAFIFKQPKGGHNFPWTWRQDSYKVLRDVLNYHPHGQLGLFAERKGKEAIPALRKALDDPSQKKHWIAAHHLGLLGDKSGLPRLLLDLNALAPKGGEGALEVARVLAELGDAGGYGLAVRLASKGTSHERWRAAEVLCYIANIDKNVLKVGGMDPIGELKKMAAEERDSNVFFVYLNWVHKILRNRPDMIAIFAIAKDSKYQAELKVPWGTTVAGVYHFVAVRDKDQPYGWK